MSSVDQVLPILQPALARLKLLAEDVTVTPAGKRSVLRVAVDHDLDPLQLTDDTTTVPPLTLDEVAEASSVVSTALDECDVMGARPYVLEVTSPGTDRALTLPRHFRRNVGRLITVSMLDGTDITGRIREVQGKRVRIAVQPDPGSRGVSGPDTATREVTVDEIVRAHVQVEFSHAPEQEN